MPLDIEEVHGRRIALCPPDGPLLRTAGDATDLIGETRSADASTVVVPIERLDPAFFQLRTGVAGEFVQKFVNYRVTLVVLGDTTEIASKSKALHDFIYESNLRGSIWFLTSKRDLEERLARDDAPH